MVRPLGSGKHTPARLLVVLCIGLLGIALVADLFWASSPRFSSSSYLATGWAPQEKPQTSLVLPSKTTQQSTPTKEKVLSQKNGTLSERILSATFADLPAPELKWEKMASAPVPRLDGAAIQIGSLLYVFAGYGTIDLVHSHVDIYNFTNNTWEGRFDMPKEMAHSHLGMVTDGRFIYVVTGQYGPQCRGPTAHTFLQ